MPKISTVLKQDFSFNGLEPLFLKTSAWIGNHDPINASSIHPRTTLSKNHYYNYDVVWIYERDLFSYYKWPKILFKSLQILNTEEGGGNLVLRTKDSKFITFQRLKNFFDELSYLNVTIKNQINLTDGTLCTHFFITRNKDLLDKENEFYYLVNKSYSNYKRLFHILSLYINNFTFLSLTRFLHHILPQDIKEKLNIRSRINHILLRFYFAIHKKKQ